MSLLNFGSLNIDYVYEVDHIVKKGETISSTGLFVAAGGKGLNQSIAVKRAGSEIYHAGFIGADGKFLQDLLNSEGVDTTYLRVVDGHTGTAVIQRDVSGDNSIIVNAGVNAMVSLEYADEVLIDFGVGDMLVLQNEVSSIPYIIERAYEKGLKIVFNPSPIKENLKEIDFGKISYLVVNETEAREILNICDKDAARPSNQRDQTENEEELVKSLSALTGKVLLTLGDKGSYLINGKDEILFQPAFRVDAIDTTAAGDTFLGYFVSSLNQGLDEKTSLIRAAKAASIAVTRPGAAQSVPQLDEVI